MVGSSERRKIVQALIWLPVYAEWTDRDTETLTFDGTPSYANKKAQNFLREMTKPCFSQLRSLLKRLSQDDLVKMRKNHDKATQICDKLRGLENSRAKIPRNEREAFEAIEFKIEDCLDSVEGARRALRDSTFRVEGDLADMRAYLDAYDELLQHLKKRDKVEYYRRIIAEAEKEYGACREHLILRLNADQKREELLGHLRDKRRREAYRPTRADVLEAYYMGW